MKKTAVVGAMALAVGLMFAVSFGGATPALADEGKITICHWDTGFTTPNPNSAAFRAPSWVVIEINERAKDAHIGVHTDGAEVDEQIIGGFTEALCLARNDSA